MPWTTPNILTFLRLVLIPVIVFFYLLDYSGLIVLGIFILAGVTDWADGAIARRLKATSQFGAFLDPVADKLVIATLLVLLVSDNEVATKLINHNFFTLSVLVIVGREITVSALREWMSQIGHGSFVSVNMLGKIKTTVQFIAIGVLVGSKDTNFNQLFAVGEYLLYLAAILTVWSMIVYLVQAINYR